MVTVLLMVVVVLQLLLLLLLQRRDGGGRKSKRGREREDPVMGPIDQSFVGQWTKVSPMLAPTEISCSCSSLAVLLLFPDRPTSIAESFMNARAPSLCLGTSAHCSPPSLRAREGRPPVLLLLRAPPTLAPSALRRPPPVWLLALSPMFHRSASPLTEFHVVVTCFALLSLGGARGASDCCHDWSSVNGREAVGRTHFMGSHWLMTPALQRPRLRSHGVDRRSPNLASRSHSSQIGGAAAEAGAPKLAAPSQPCSLPESRKSPWAMDGWSAMLTRLARGNFRLPRLFFSIPKMACFARK
ncbi:hypothetical protein Mp_4g04370 [Marchantia polymorpha subsp. ruderalis]|uniref:Secreted protein n=2 Tax=Marchantia polymorpha TaxID=3197 RepID=A0AAF6B6A3_MARPO|nr:hypothetical protein MARPO_0044s0036 [Marchantia polymorpha]BBN07537.1 hypothetical protein Mp_4g04370 [Marchantia polymorpha subsp. ruderalis]|eukprot:PTQ39563.1 hypothetical protein MARPO_0044s0036 [Marchantia polymorpha]